MSAEWPEDPKEPEKVSHSAGVSMTMANSAVVPTPGQEGRALLFPGRPVLSMKSLSQTSAQSGLHGDRA